MKVVLVLNSYAVWQFPPPRLLWGEGRVVHMYNIVTRLLFSVGTVVKPLPEAYSEDPKSGSESDPECRFCCGCGKCDLATYLEKGCPSLLDNDFPFLFPKKLNERDFRLLKLKLWNACEKILESFASLENHTIYFRAEGEKCPPQWGCTLRSHLRGHI